MLLTNLTGIVSRIYHPTMMVENRTRENMFLEAKVNHSLGGDSTEVEIANKKCQDHSSIPSLSSC